MPALWTTHSASRMVAQALAVCAGVLIAGMGMAGILVPERFMSMVAIFQAPAMLYASAAIRIAVGAVLLVAARDSRSPRFLLAAGAIILAGGLVTPIVGTWMGQTILGWWAAWGPGLVRVWGMIAVAFGIFILYAVSPGERSD